MSDDVRLRDVEEADLDTLHRYEDEPEANERSQFPARDRDRFVNHWITNVLGDPTVFVQAVTVDGALAGSVVAWWEGDRRYVGYWLGRPFWGRGVGTRALALFLARERARPLYADPFEGNTGSVRLLEKSGFRRAGTVRHGDNEHVLLVLGGEQRQEVSP
jgi:RimJ/RimL family protein N-acetyltransferase